MLSSTSTSTSSSNHPSSRPRGRSPAAKDRDRGDRLRISPLSLAPTASSSSSKMSIPFSLPVLHRGRRRILLPLLVLALLFLFLFSSHDLLGLPPALHGLRRVSPANIAALVQNRGVTEMHGLLYYAVHESDQALAHDAPDPTRPLDLSVYADGELAPKPDWLARVKHLDAEAPLIVFSKVRLSVFCLLMAGMAELGGRRIARRWRPGIAACAPCSHGS